MTENRQEAHHWTTIERVGLIIGSILVPVITVIVGQDGVCQIWPKLPFCPDKSGEIIPDKIRDVKNVPSGRFNEGGSTTWAPIRGEVDPIIENIHPDFDLRYSHPPNNLVGSTWGIEKLIAKQLEIAQSSRPLKLEEKTKAVNNGVEIEERKVALDAIAIAVNPDLELKGITTGQLKDIYTGKITNWKQVGGPNLPIKVYSRHRNAGGTVTYFVEDVLGKEDFGKNIEYVKTTTEGLREVGGNPGGIYYASAPEVIPQCTVKGLPIINYEQEIIPPYQEPLITEDECKDNNRNTLNISAFKNADYPLTRSLFVVIRKDGGIAEQAGKAYITSLLTKEGQELIEKSGFVRIR